MKKSNLLQLKAEIEKNGKYAVFFDIDGTIMPVLSKRGASTRLARAIDAAKKNGHCFFLNTGRALGYVDKSVLHSASFDGIISGLGSSISFHGEQIYSSLVPNEIKQSTAVYCHENNESIIFEGQPDSSDGRICFGKAGMFGVERSFDRLEDFLELAEKSSITKITIPYIPSDGYLDFLSRHYDMTIVTHLNYAEGAIKGNHKGTGIKRVCKLLSIPEINTLAVGDSENDISMLTHCGIPVAMGNAPDSLKALCRYVCDDVENDGAAELVEQLFV